MAPFFTELTPLKGLLYLCATIYVIGTALAVCTEPFLTLPCNYDGSHDNLKFDNVLFEYNPCKSNTRYARLMGLTRIECSFGRHMVVAVILGCIIGYERREADRPAGIRTMALVSLAACLFTINSVFAFLIGPMHWDPARVSAAIPSGVGFLGTALIVKAQEKDEISGEIHHIVQGVNTAASVWLSAAVGAACGGGLYFVASFTACLMLCLLRFGPRSLDKSHPSHSVLGKGGRTNRNSVLGFLPTTVLDNKKIDSSSLSDPSPMKDRGSVNYS